ncbi:conserved Plasmodium protein, unknown function [Plasmodium ovale]|uniref:Uncharacterized protein n=1 Tax=Plasmodium ovale TaxID=36330 RepID=A0A1C3KPQ5_PLAOA|nr:conserved Plasmodium protein, unknown function [Plasmodium ovale]
MQIGKNMRSQHTVHKHEPNKSGAKLEPATNGTKQNKKQGEEFTQTIKEKKKKKKNLLHNSLYPKEGSAHSVKRKKLKKDNISLNSTSRKNKTSEILLVHPNEKNTKMHTEDFAKSHKLKRKTQQKGKKEKDLSEKDEKGEKYSNQKEGEGEKNSNEKKEEVEKDSNEKKKELFLKEKNSPNNIIVLKNKSKEELSPKNKNEIEIESSPFTLSSPRKRECKNNAFIEVSKSQSYSKNHIELNGASGGECAGSLTSHLREPAKVKGNGKSQGDNSSFGNSRTNSYSSVCRNELCKAYSNVPSNAPSKEPSKTYSASPNNAPSKEPSKTYSASPSNATNNAPSRSYHPPHINDKNHKTNLFCELTEALKNDCTQENCNSNLNVRLMAEEEKFIRNVEELDMKKIFSSKHNDLINLEEYFKNKSTKSFGTNKRNGSGKPASIISNTKKKKLKNKTTSKERGRKRRNVNMKDVKHEEKKPKKGKEMSQLVVLKRMNRGGAKKGKAIKKERGKEGKETKMERDTEVKETKKERGKEGKETKRERDIESKKAKRERDVEGKETKMERDIEGKETKMERDIEGKDTKRESGKKGKETKRERDIEGKETKRERDIEGKEAKRERDVEGKETKRGSGEEDINVGVTEKVGERSKEVKEEKVVEPEVILLEESKMKICEIEQDVERGGQREEPSGRDKEAEGVVDNGAYPGERNDVDGELEKVTPDEGLAAQKTRQEQQEAREKEWVEAKDPEHTYECRDYVAVEKLEERGNLVGEEGGEEKEKIGTKKKTKVKQKGKPKQKRTEPKVQEKKLVVTKGQEEKLVVTKGQEEKLVVGKRQEEKPTGEKEREEREEVCRENLKDSKKYESLFKVNSKRLSSPPEYNSIKNSKADKILMNYLHLRKEEDMEKALNDRMRKKDILEISEKNFKIDTINFLTETKIDVCFYDILFFFDSYKKKLKKKKLNSKKLMRLFKKLFRCESFELDGMQLVVNIFDKIAQRLKKEFKIEHITKCFGEEKHIIASKILKAKNKNENGSPYPNEGLYNYREMYGQHGYNIPGGVNLVDRKKMYNIIFSSRKDYTTEPYPFLLLEQWNNRNMLIMLRDKLDEMKRRKKRVNIPMTYIKSVKRNLVFNLFSMCCFRDKELDTYEFQFPPPPCLHKQRFPVVTLQKHTLSTSHVNDSPLKMGDAVRFLACT